MKEKAESLSESLRRLEAILSWFDDQESVDVEKGLAKVKEGALLLKTSRERLKAVENEFEIVRKELERE